MYKFLFSLLTLTACQVTSVTPQEEFTSVYDYGISPGEDISEKFADTIVENPHIDNWYFPPGEYFFTNFSMQLIGALSNKKISGSSDDLSVFSFQSSSPVDIILNNINHVVFQNIAWKNTRLVIQNNSSDIQFNGNIFYGLKYTGNATNDHSNGDVKTDHILVFGEYRQSGVARNLTVSDSVFLRSAHKKFVYQNTPLPPLEQAAPEDNQNYMVRREYGIRLLTVSNTVIKNNAFGLTRADIESSISFAKTSGLRSAIRRATKLLTDKDPSSIHSENQNYFTTSINSVPDSLENISTYVNDGGTAIVGTLPRHTARHTRIIHNLFNGWYANDYMKKAFLSNETKVGGDDNRFFDHAVYLRGSINTIVGGNHVKGYPNGSSGGLKFKSGIDLSVVNNILDNTGLIFARSWELGEPSKSTDGIFFRVLVQGNLLIMSEAIGSYKMGISFDDHVLEDTLTDKTKITNGFRRIRKVVFADNKITKMILRNRIANTNDNSIYNPTLLRLNDVNPTLLNGVYIPPSVVDTGIQVKNNTYETIGDEPPPYESKVKNMRLIQDRTKLNDANPLLYLYPEVPFLFPDVMMLHKNEISSLGL